jgi:hypothetical protein
MWACGDVQEPDADSVDTLEDLVIDFVADLVSIHYCFSDPR